MNAVRDQHLYFILGSHLRKSLKKEGAAMERPRHHGRGGLGLLGYAIRAGLRPEGRF